MEILAASDIAGTIDFVLNILYVAIGLGLVIFFHELGHFAVAKWCDVHVERFSIGFGPVLFKWGRGETEYAFSAIPFGGYVKMLGQDDIDPSQLSAEEIAQDPRSYSAKSVPQRMAIISAGVIMNVLTAGLFFAIAFGLGVETEAPVLGTVRPGMPAWEAGLQHGDRITKINGRDVTSFSDIMRGVALSTGTVTVEGIHRDGEPFEMTMRPQMIGTRRMIGVGPTRSLQLIGPQRRSLSSTVQGTAAARAEPPFEPGDTIHRLEQTSLESFSQLRELLAREEYRSRAVDFYVMRKSQESSSAKQQSLCIRVPANRFRELGLSLDIGPITSLIQGSQAEKAGLKKKDKIVKVNGREVGTDLDPLRLPDYLARFHGQEVSMTVKRPVQGADPENVTVQVVPTDDPGWIERPIAPETPVAVPSVGFAYHLTRTVLKVEPDSPAAGKIQAGSRLKTFKLVRPESAPSDGLAKRVLEIDLTGEANNWAYAFWMMQTFPTRTVELTISNAGQERQLELEPQPIEGHQWYLPTRGVRLELLATTQKADDLLEAATMAVVHTRNSLFDIYLTLRNLLGGFLSVKELRGPIGIATVAYQVAAQGLAKLLLFLGFLSVNLAVLNFLPIPVLDGGHMVFLIWEAIARQKPSERVVVAATYVGMLFVLSLMLLVIYLDIFVHGMSAP